MPWFGDGIVFLSATASLIYALRILFSKKKLAFYFQLIIGAIGCHVLGYLFDVCEFFANGTLAEGFMIGYLGTIGCFLFLLTASFGYMDGILDDGTAAMEKSRYIALLAPLAALLLLVPNLIADIPLQTKVWYVLVWIPASFCSYFNLKHAIIPDMDFGFVKAIRPFNVAALSFTMMQLVHLTLWSYCGWGVLLLSGALFGASCIVMTVMAERGVKKWIL